MDSFRATIDGGRAWGHSMTVRAFVSMLLSALVWLAALAGLLAGVRALVLK